MPRMRVRSSLPGLIVLLLVLGLSRDSLALPRRDGAFFPQHPLSSGASPALSDLDGDGQTDLVKLTWGGLWSTIELYLSRTDEWRVLPVRAAAAGRGSLSAQDVDGDGDTDLLWQGSLRSHPTLVWLNDGVGRFECVRPPEAR